MTERKEWGELQAFRRSIIPLLEMRPFYARKLEQSFLERMLTRELPEPEELAGVLQQYCRSVCSEAAALYRDEALADPEFYALPSRYRFAVMAGEALKFIDERRFAESFPLFKEAVRFYPEMSEAIGVLLRYLEKQIQTPSVPEEFEILGGQVKQVLRGMIDKGQWTEAEGVMVQLLSLLPDDPEVLRMKQEILSRE